MPIFLVIFLLPFAAGGAFSAVRAIELASRGNWREATLFGCAALVFGGVGFGGLVGVRVASGKLREEARLKDRYPGEPWRWRPDWASGRIDDSSRMTMWSAWAFALMWNLISLLSGYLGVQTALKEGKPAAYLALLFPLVGIGLLIWAVKATLRYHKYGVSRLELATVPGIIGHTLTGTVRASTSLQPPEGFQVILSCIRRVTTRGGKSSSTTETVLWQDERQVTGELSRDPVGMGTNIPIAFQVPADSRPCDSSDAADRIIWRLQLAASVPGVDYQSVFEVPVYRTSASDVPLSEAEDRLTRDPIDLSRYQQPPKSRIVVSTNQRGTEILFPAARNPGAAIGMTVFTLIWCASVMLLLHLRAPIVFPIIVGLFGLLLVFLTLDLWLGVSRVTADRGGLTLATGYVYPGRERQVGASQISDVTTSIGMRSGTTLYYDVTVVGRDGKKIDRRPLGT